MTLPPRPVAYISRKITCPDDDSRARPKYLRCIMSVAALVKTLGDGFMIVFTSADDALDCVVSIQRAFDERNRSRSPAIRVRIGVHTGAAIHLAGDFVGRDVALAARITSQARGGQIIVSDVTSISTAGVTFAFRALPATSLDGFQQTFRLHRLEWDVRPALRAIAGGTLGSS